MRKPFLYTCFFLCCSYFLFGQELLFQNYRIEDGFTHSGTSFHNSIWKDDQGFVWFVTYNGMSRFDGEHFKNYKHDPSNSKSIPGNLLTVIGEDNQKRLWVGTANRGIYIFDKEKESFSNFKSTIKEGDKVLKAHIYFIKKDAAGNMWYGGQNGLAKWNSQTNEVDNFDHYFDEMNAFLQQKSGEIWVGGQNGLYLKVANKNHFKKIATTHPIGYISDLIELENGKLWLATSSGLWEFNPSDLSFKDLSEQEWILKNEHFKSINFARGNKGDIWLASSLNILRYNQRTGKTSFYQNNPKNSLSLPPVTPEDIFIDDFDNLFVNTGGYGMAFAHTQANPFEIIGDFKSIEYIKLDAQRILIRDFNKGGIIYDTKKGVVSSEKIPIGPGSIFVPSLAMRGDSLLWIWNSNTIQSYHLRTKKLTTAPQNPVRSLYVTTDKKGRVWNGLSYLDEHKNEWVNIYPELQEIFSELVNLKFSYANIYFDEKNQLWAKINGTTTLIRYNLITKKGKRYQVDGKPYPGSNGRFYANSPEGLGIYLPKQDSFLHLTEKEGLLHSSLFHVREDADGNAWIATPKGLQKYDKHTKTFMNLDFEDGFPEKGRVLVRYGERDDDGYMYFDINMEKVFRFHPDSLLPNNERASIHFLDFFLNRLVVSLDKDSTVLQKNIRYINSIDLNYKQVDFGFNFVMPIFYKSKEIEYFYKLSPYQKEWQSNGTSNEVHYTNINPGKYTFSVKAKSASGVWSANEASVQIFITPPWWKTWWAYLVYSITFIMVLMGIRSYDLRRKLANTEARRLKELDSLKSRLYTNITHEFRTPLTVIMGIADNIKGYVQERKLIRRNGKNLLRLINQLLDLSKLDSGTMKMDMIQGDIINYLRYLSESFYSMAQEKEIALIFNTSTDRLEMDFDEVKIQHIVYNLLSNAIKFTESGGEVRISVSRKIKKDQSWLLLKVEDTGQGVDSAQIPHIFDRFYQADNSTTRKGEGTGIGLALTKELIKMMDGDIKVESEQNKGTTFMVYLPAKMEISTPKTEADFANLPGKSIEITTETTLESTEEIIDQSVNRPLLLLIEDNKDVAAYIKTLLKKEYEITTAINGQIGINKALEIIPDIIISDVMMPEKDGFEVCETLKKDIRTSHIPIVLLTAKAEQKDKITGLKHGADAYLMKPFDKAELFVRLEKLLELRKALQKRYATSASKSVKEITPEKPTLEDLFLQKLTTATEEIMANPENAIANLQKAMQLSQMQLYRKLKALIGQTPSLFIRSVRLQKAKQLLQTTDLNVSEIAYEVGFTDPAYFSRAFNEAFGTPPRNSRN